MTSYVALLLLRAVGLEFFLHTFCPFLGHHTEIDAGVGCMDLEVSVSRIPPAVE
jgi:hypothetical protein